MRHPRFFYMPPPSTICPFFCWDAACCLRVTAPCRDVSLMRLRAHLTLDAILWCLYQSSVPLFLSWHCKYTTLGRGLSSKLAYRFFINICACPIVKRGNPICRIYSVCARYFFRMSALLVWEYRWGALAAKSSQLSQFTVYFSRHAPPISCESYL